MKLTCLAFFILYIACNWIQDEKPTSINGIWIPQEINWEQGNFETFYFQGNSSVIIISSVQRKVKDSIIFATEPGFNIKKGVIKSIGNNKFVISGTVIYRFIKLTGVTNDAFQDTVIVSLENHRHLIKVDTVSYQKGALYTNESKRRIVAICTEMVSDIEKHPEKYK
jgi:hypothetical protein